MKIRKVKKAMKNSNNFFTAVMDNGMCFCSSEWYIIKYHKHGISMGNAEYLPYTLIKKLIING